MIKIKCNVFGQILYKLINDQFQCTVISIEECMVLKIEWTKKFSRHFKYKDRENKNFTTKYPWWTVSFFTWHAPVLTSFF